MLRKYKITYVEAKTPQHHTVEVKAYSKYNAKKRFYVMKPLCDIIKIEEVQGDDGTGKAD